MNAQPRRVRIVDTSTRDGNQSLWGATGLTTGMVEALGPALERAGFHAVDFTSSTHLSVGVRWHKEDPWERIRRMRAAMPSTPLSLITTGMRFMSWDRSPEALMRLALRCLAEAGLRRIQIAEPMNDTDSALAVARMAKDEGIEHVVAAVTFTESPVHTDDIYRKAAGVLAGDLSVDAVYLKDPGGLLTLERTRTLIPEMLDTVGSKPLELHSHCTTGVAPQIYVLAAQLGVEVLHTAIGALANGTSQPSLTRLASNLATVGIATDVNIEAVAEAEEIIAKIAQTQGLEPGIPAEYDLSYHLHQVPGGMMGTLRRQLAEVEMADALPAVLQEVSRVRAELGYPIMVTPYSQFVGTQAVLNVLAVRSGGQRWNRLPDEIIRYVLGHFGTPIAPIDDKIRERVESSPRTRELDQPRPRPSIDKLREQVRVAVGRDVSDGDVVLRSVLPGDQVEAMKRAGTASRWCPARPVNSLRDLVDAVSALPRWRSLHVTRGGESLTLARENQLP